MPKSFIHFKPITGNSEAHNTRAIKPKYLVPPSAENYHWSCDSIQERRAHLEKAVKARTGRTMQKKATPIREAVILLPDDDNFDNSTKLHFLAEQLEEEFGIKCFQMHIHNDEGHINENGEVKYNYHAHLVFDWMYDGKSIKLDKQDMSRIQTITAEYLGMERGVEGSKSLSLNHHEFRGYLQIKDKLEKQRKKELTPNQQKEIRQAIIEERPRRGRRR